MNLKRFTYGFVTLLTVILGLEAGQGNWTPLVNDPTFLNGALGQLLLTDGSILVRDTWNPASDANAVGTRNIWKLTPDIYGSYVNGTWSQLAPLPANYNPLFYASAVLADGRVIFQGGEFNGVPDFDHAEFIVNIGAIYDPVTNVWTNVAPPPFFPPKTIGDAASVVLEDGTFMLQNKRTKQAALLDLKTMTWTETGTATKFDINNEEGWTLLPNGKVLTVDCYVGVIPYPSDPTGSEIYNPKTGTWSSAGSTIQTLTDPDLHEIGAQVLRPDGTVFVTGSNGNTGIYNTHTGQWQIGPRLPKGSRSEGQLGAQDGSGALLPNGNVLFSAGPIDPFFGNGLHFFEFNGSQLFEQPTVPNAPILSSFSAYMLVLPTGQIMVTGLGSGPHSPGSVLIYTPSDTSYDPQWAPRICSAPKKVHPRKTYEIKGIRFNGMSQGAMFGDDYQSATNYPLVRITNCKTSHVFYCRTHDHSFMGVASKKKVSTCFDVPSDIEYGESILEVVVNGIPSKPVCIDVTSKKCVKKTACHR